MPYDKQQHPTDDEQNESTGKITLSRRTILGAFAATGASASGLGAFAGVAAAAPGDTLATVDLPNAGAGVGITFTGQYVIVPDGLRARQVDIFEPPSGSGNATYVATKEFPLGRYVSGIEWDPSRNALWATNGQDDGFGPSDFLLVDLGDLATTALLDSADITSQFSLPTEKQGWPADGIAYDGSDDTLWWSPDGSEVVWKLDTDGTELREIVPEANAAGDELTHISGVAVGAPRNGRPTLYLGDNASETGAGVNRVVRVFADNGENIQTFTDVDFRVEDIVCDPVTYAPSEALLIKDAGVNRYRAFEVEQGTCPLPGRSEDDTECDPTVTVDLIADGGSDATAVIIGTVTVAGLDDELTVTYSLADDWFLRETHLHVAGDENEDGHGDCDRTPQTRNGNPQVGRFALSRDYGPGVQQDTYVVDRDAKDNAFNEEFSPGEQLCIAAHAAVFQDQDGDETFDPDVDREETAWVEGTAFVDEGSWAMHVAYQNPCVDNPFPAE